MQQIRKRERGPRRVAQGGSVQRESSRRPSASSARERGLSALQARANQGPRVRATAGLQETMNRGPSVWPATPSGEVAQRVRIGGERIYPTGRNGKALLEKVRLAMFSAGLSPHGSTKTFKEVVQQDVDFPDDEAFVTAFVNLAKQEVLRVQKEKASGKKKVRGWTRPLKIGRPAWPEAYKKAVTKGEDIRHIVRNATLKNAIEAERDHQAEFYGETQALDVMTQIADAIGIQEKFGHSVEATLAIYRNAYLNLGNLFPGAGAINRVIGLTADRISGIGAKLLSSDDFAEPSKISELFEEVAFLVAEVGDQMDRQAEKMNPETAKIFLGGFEDFFDNLEDYLIDREEELVKAASTSPEKAEEELSGSSMEEEMLIGVTEAQIGRELLDIGANFGFDIPDEALQREDMQQLVMTEIFLANYTPGNPKELADALSHFMKVKNVMEI